MSRGVSTSGLKSNMIGSGRRGFGQVLAPELRHRNYKPGKAGKGEKTGVLPEMKLTGAISQTNEASTAGILGYHSHRSPAIWNSTVPKPSCLREKAQCRITDSLTTSTRTVPMLRGKVHQSIFNVQYWICHQHTIHALEPSDPADLVRNQCCASDAMPFIPAITRFKSLSHRSVVVDLSVLRPNFTGSCRGLDFLEHLRLPSHAFLPTPHHDYSAVKRRHPRLSLEHALSYLKSGQVTPLSYSEELQV